MPRTTATFIILTLALALGACGGPSGPKTMRIATFNVGDLRTTDLRDANNLRAGKLAEVIQGVDADVLVLTNINRDLRGVSGTSEFDPEGVNAERLEETFIAVPQGPGEPIAYQTYMPTVNSGRLSRRDLDQNGQRVTRYLTPAGSKDDGSPPEPDPRATSYALDAWGFGEFPGQRGMALLVREGWAFNPADVRTFTDFRWASVPSASRPRARAGTGDYYDFADWQEIPLFQSTMFLAPITPPSGKRFWVAALYAGPTTGDLADNRSYFRRLDEVRALGDLVDGAAYLQDDSFNPVPPEVLKEPVVVLADLGIDPTEPPVETNPAARLLAHERFDASPAPVADVARPTLGPADSARDGGRRDFVLIDNRLRVEDAGVYRTLPSDTVAFPSDRFPVWVEVRVPR